MFNTVDTVEDGIKNSTFTRIECSITHKIKVANMPKNAACRQDAANVMAI